MRNDAVRITHLNDGLRIVSDYMPHARSVAVGLWIRCGSAYETESNNGISHFIEHMLFKGTKKRSAREIAQSLESVGGSLNASTGKEVSVYQALTLSEHLPLAVDVLSDLVLHPKFDRHEIEREKSVVLSEISHALEDPEDLAIDYLYRNIFFNNPLGFFIYGTPQNVQHFRRDDLVNHLERFYTRDRMVLAAAGKVDHQRLVSLAERYLSKAPRSLEPLQEIPPSATSNDRFYLHQPSLQQAHICRGVKIFGFRDPRKYGLALLDMLLGGGMSSRLFQNIREKYGFSYSAYSFVDLMSTCGVLGCYLGCDAKKIDRSLELLDKEFAKLRRDVISRSELDRLKSQAKGNIVLGLESSGRRMYRIAEEEIYQGEHSSIDKIVEEVEKVQPQMLTELAREFLNPEQMVTVIISPRDDFSVAS